MIRLSDQNMATNPQCYKDREDYSRRSFSLLCGLTTKLERTYLPLLLLDN